MPRLHANWLANIPLTVKLTLAFGAIFLCFLTTAVFIFSTFEKDAVLRDQERQQIQMIGLVEDAGKHMRMQQLAIRDYLIRQDQADLDNLDQMRREREEDLVEAKGLAGVDRAADYDDVIVVARSWDRGIERFLAEHARALGEAEKTRMGRRYLDENRNHAEEVQARLDKLYEREVQRYIQSREQMRLTIDTARWFILSMLVITALLILLILWLISRQVASPIRRLAVQISELANGKHDIDVSDLRREDEVGAIANALEVFRVNAVRASKDNWVKLSSGEVLSALQAADSPGTFCEALINQISSKIGAPLGVCFLWDETRNLLVLAGSSGFRHRKHLGLEYALGEGLTGQSAKERKRIVLENVPDDYFGIHSATGESRPRHVVAQPLVLRDRLLGVLEFATFEHFTPVQEAFLDEVMPAAALGLDNIHGVERTQHLLQQTQAQAGELQRTYESLRVQEEELRAANEELQGKTVELEEHSQRLSASEEELRVQAEELQASNEELRQKSDTLNQQKEVLQSLQRETELKAQELARASQYKTDFLANMSHELRTPLNSLLILSRELADNETGHLDAGEVEAAQVIHDSGSNLLRLINDILDLSKIEAGKMDVLIAPVEVASITHELQRHFRHMAVDKHLEFAIEVLDGVPEMVSTDRPKLQQILNNLLGNAFKFTHSGRVDVRIAMADGPMLARIGASAQARYLTISVADTGIGIHEDRLASIFEAFEQVDSSSSRHYGGSGLGLAIALRLATLLYGHLVVDSKVEEGSTFTLLLPLDIEVTSASAPQIGVLPEAGPGGAQSLPSAVMAPSESALIGWIPDDRHTIAPGDKVILTIEDDIAFARILVDMIRKKGLRALAASDGESGLELARRYRPAGILLDVMLPGMDGWSVMNHLKRDPVTASTPVHFISAVDEADKGRALGAIGYLTKPVDRQSLQRAFDHLLDVAGKIVRKLLVVDDDPAARVALIHLLQNDKVEIHEASTGEEAIELVGTQHYDCIVLDLNLGGISGSDFLERASAMGVMPPVVIYSGRELAQEESLRLRQYTDSIVIKGDRSPERLLDEVSLFLHSLGSRAGPVVESGNGTDLAGRSVLLVDDDMRNLFALSKALRSRGLNVLMAQDGFKALQQLEENPEVALVVMDIMMPGMDGYETIGEIRKRPHWSKLPIIAVTAKAMQGDRDKCLEAGANDYLAKPVDLDKLMSMMRVWLLA